MIKRQREVEEEYEQKQIKRLYIIDIEDPHFSHSDVLPTGI